MSKRIFASMMRFMVMMYRMTKGGFGGRIAGLNVLLLTTTGRKTGKQRTTLLGYFEQEGDYVIIASNAGDEKHPAWYHNLKSNPRATVLIKDHVVNVSAEIASSEKRDQLWAHLVQISPWYDGYEKKTSRVIPMIVLHPTTA